MGGSSVMLSVLVQTLNYMHVDRTQVEGAATQQAHMNQHL